MVIKHTRPSLELQDSIAIVGSSSVLGKQKAAKKIDGFKEVIRFNRAPTEGWENIAGSKTTLRIVNGHVFQNVKFKRWKEDDDFVKNLRNSRILVAGEEFSEKTKYQHTDNSNEVVWLDVRKAISVINFTFKTQFSLPTVGLLGIALVVLGGVKPHIFGWSGGEMSHYYNKRDSSGSGYHNFSSEWDLIQKLAQSGDIKLH